MAPKRGDGLLSITVKLTMRSPILSSEDLSKPLNTIYREIQAKQARNKKEKRINAKLVATTQKIYLTSGSWWTSGVNQPDLYYSQIIQCSLLDGRPNKVLLCVSSKDKINSELVLIKTKGPTLASQLVRVIKQKMDAINEQSNQSHALISQPVNYQDSEFQPVNSKATSPVSKKNSLSTALQELVSLQASASESSNHQTESFNERSVDYITHKVHRLSSIDDEQTPRRSSAVKSIHSHTNEVNTEFTNGIRKPSRQITKDNEPKRPVIRKISDENASETRSKADTFSSVINYEKRAQLHHVPEQMVIDRPKKAKRRTSQKLTQLGVGRGGGTEYDENDTPWEVNICYIKHDPMVGCVEDESGPIYMYSAHQLVTRNADNNSSGDSNSSSDSSDSDMDSDSTVFSETSDEENELDQFMLRSRPVDPQARAKSMTNGGRAVQPTITRY